MRESLASHATRKESLQSYLTIRLLVDKDLVEDAYRAYAYFRWVDDRVDVNAQSNLERIAFIRSQRELVKRLYSGLATERLGPEETMIAELVRNDRGPHSRLASYIKNFLGVIEFDAARKGRRVTSRELADYSDRLAVAVTDAILYFIHNGHDYAEDERRTAAARAAHVTHMLRDMREDVVAGYWNIPSEYLDVHGIEVDDFDRRDFQVWVRARVEDARENFRLGKEYIDGLDVLRTKLAARWYCARFEHVLDTIERDGYLLREEYPGNHGALGLLRMLSVGFYVALRHTVGKLTKTVAKESSESRAVMVVAGADM